MSTKKVTKLNTYKKEETVAPAKASLEYSGNVTIKIKKGDTVVQVIKSHNSGGQRLFEYLCKCLAGYNTNNNMEDADELRPTKIMLFYNSASTPGSAKPTEDITSVTGFITFNTVPEPVLEDGKWLVRYHFLIPYTSFKMGSSGTSLSVNQLMLYGKKEEDQDKYSACYFLTNDANQWQFINISSSDTNFSIIVDWELSIENKTA